MLIKKTVKLSSFSEGMPVSSRGINDGEDPVVFSSGEILRELSDSDFKKMGLAGSIHVMVTDQKPIYVPMRSKSGRVVHEMFFKKGTDVKFAETIHNRVLDDARKHNADTYDPNVTANIRKFSKIAVGDGGWESGVVTTPGYVPPGEPALPAVPPGPLGGDTQLYHEIFRKAIDVVDRPTDHRVRSQITFDLLEANGELTEFGLITQDIVTTNEYLFSRRTRRSISKQNDLYFSIKWTILF